MIKLPLETLLLKTNEDGSKYYKYIEKNKNYDLYATVKVGCFEVPNTKTYYYDMDFNNIRRPKYKNTYEATHAKTEIVTDEAIIAKFGLIHSKLSIRNLVFKKIEEIKENINKMDIESLNNILIKLNEINEL